MKESKKKHIISYFMIITLLVSCLLCGCGKKKTVKPKDSLEEDVQTALYDKGISTFDTLWTLTNDHGYVSNIGITKSMEGDYYKIVACPYEKLANVYRVSHLQDATDTYVDIAGETMSKDTIPYFKNSIVEGMGNMIISYTSGVSEVAVSSVLHYETSFINKSLNTAEAYIYCYYDSYPILVTFIPGDDGTVRAKASYLLADKLINIEPEELANCVRGYFNATSLEPIYQ